MALLDRDGRHRHNTPALPTQTDGGKEFFHEPSDWARGENPVVWLAIGCALREHHEDGRLGLGRKWSPDAAAGQLWQIIEA